MGGAKNIIEHNYIHDYGRAGIAHNDGVKGRPYKHNLRYMCQK